MLKKLKKAFTITELVIVIAVIAILAAVLIPTFANVIENANQSAAMQTAHNAMQDYSSIAAMEGEADNSGVVFVSDDYVYVNINSGLHYVGKLDKLVRVNGSDGTFQNDDALEGVDGVTMTTTTNPTAAGQVTITLTGSGDTTNTSPKPITVASLAAVTDVKVTENLYFYTVEINKTTYFGWFTLESGTTEAPALYQTQGATYSRQYGFAAVAAEATATTYTVEVTAQTTATVVDEEESA